jgi:HAD superfamily hydrolase (TIGR01459 family)
MDERDPRRQPASSAIPIVEGIAPLLDGVQAWICDLWGVVHNGVSVFAPAIEACQRFRASGGAVLFLTNAPRPAAAIGQQLVRLGVPRDAYDVLLTSGDLTLDLIAAKCDLPLLHLGPERDKGLFTGLNIEFSNFDNAGVIVCSGLYDDETETAADYRDRLGPCALRGVEMICANPDIRVARGDKVIECAGALARLYEELGGRVVYAGKPHLPVYHRAMEMLSSVKGRGLLLDSVMAIGDGIYTDMRGAATAGLPSVFVASPIHVRAPLDPAALSHLFEDLPRRPIAAMTALAW